MKNEVDNCDIEKKLKEYSQMDKKQLFEKLQTSEEEISIVEIEEKIEK